MREVWWCDPFWNEDSETRCTPNDPYHLSRCGPMLLVNPNPLVVEKDENERPVPSNPTKRTHWPEWALDVLISWGAAENADYHPHAVLDDLLEASKRAGR